MKVNLSKIVLAVLTLFLVVGVVFSQAQTAPAAAKPAASQAKSASV